MLLASATSALPRMRAPAHAAHHSTHADAVRIVGALAESAQAQCSPAGHAFVRVLISQAAGLPAIVALRCMGLGPAAQIAAHSAANRLRKGHVVSAWGAAIQPIAANRGAQLELVGCTGLVEHIQDEDDQI